MRYEFLCRDFFVWLKTLLLPNTNSFELNEIHQLASLLRDNEFIRTSGCFRPHQLPQSADYTLEALNMPKGSSIASQYCVSAFSKNLKKNQNSSKMDPQKKNFDGVPLVVAAKLVFPEKKK